eukprot:g37514.t1
MVGKWEAFKNEVMRVQTQNVPVSVKGKAGRGGGAGRLKHVKVDKSSEPDQLYPRTLWEAMELIVGPLAEIFVLLIARSEVPEDRRVVNVLPLLKKGGKENAGNYRPVSLMSVVEVTKKIDEGTVVDIVCMELNKTFDKVLH